MQQLKHDNRHNRAQGKGPEHSLEANQASHKANQRAPKNAKNKTPRADKPARKQQHLTANHKPNNKKAAQDEAVDGTQQKS
jgi:hypothetical protein